MKITPMILCGYTGSMSVPRHSRTQAHYLQAYNRNALLANTKYLYPDYDLETGNMS
jgi:hypothetical protein